MPSSSFELGSRKITLDHVRGKVMSYHKHSESYVHGSGGGHPNARTSITTHEVTQTEFIVKDENEREYPVVLRGQKNVVLSEGQEVTLFCADTDDEDSYWVYVYVHNTGQECYFNQREKVYRNKTHWHFPLLISMLFFLRAYYDLDSWVWSIIWAVLASLFVAAIVTKVFLRPAAIKKLDKQIQDYADRVI